MSADATMPPTARTRALAAVAGLAAGDAAGFPALYHRVIALPERRRLLWTQSMELDEHRVNKFSLPFVLNAPAALAMLGPTDDTEQVVLTAQMLLGVGDDPSVDQLHDAWAALVDAQGDRMWGSVADISARRNRAEGLRAPQTGNDNPHHYDDSSAVRAVAVGVRWHRDPARAAAVARRLACVTNAADGIDAAAAIAATIAAGVGGAGAASALALGRAELPADSWTGRRLRVADELLADAGSPFAAVPLWTDEVTSQEYNFGNAAPETLPLALVIAGAAGSLAEGLGLAALLPKHADTLMPMVGALIGAATGELPPASWRERLATTRGLCLPTTAGVGVDDVVRLLFDAAQARHDA